MRWKDDMRQNEQNRNAANRLGAALERTKEENQQLEKRGAVNRLGAALKRKKRMKQNQYNTYLQDETASNFGALSKGELKQQRKALQQQLNQVQGHQI